MNQTKNLVVILVILLFYSIGFCQVDAVSDSSITDSIKEESIYKLSLNRFSTNSLMSLKALLLFNSFSDYYLPEFESIEKPYKISSLEMIRIKKEMSNSFNAIRLGLNKNDLGVVGKILGYTNTAGALGLAIYQVSKHPKKYGLK